MQVISIVDKWRHRYRGLPDRRLRVSCGGECLQLRTSKHQQKAGIFHELHNISTG